MTAIHRSPPAPLPAPPAPGPGVPRQKGGFARHGRTSLRRAILALLLLLGAAPLLGGSAAAAEAKDTEGTTGAPLFWNPWNKESPEPYGYDVYTAPDLPLGQVDPNDPPAVIELVRIDPARSILSVTTSIDRTAYSWFGAVTVTAEVRRDGDLVTDCDSVVVVSAANPRVEARLRDDGNDPDITAFDGIYTGIFDVGAGEGEARPTGSYTVTATAYRGMELGTGNSSSFALYSVRRWTGITTTDLPDASDAYTAFFATPSDIGGGFHHEIRDLGLIRSSAVPNAQIRIPIFPDENTVSGLVVTGAGVADVHLEGNVIAFDCNLTGGNVTRVTIEFDAPGDLASTRIDRYQTGDIGLRDFRNGYLVWNRYIHTAILGSSFTSPHGPGCIVDLHVTDLATGDPHTIDCMERVSVHLDNVAHNDGTGTYPSNIKWDDDALSWPESGDLESLVFRFESGGNYGLGDEVFVERRVEFFAGSRAFRHRYRIENIDDTSHDFDFVWGREQWLYGGAGSDRQNGDRGLLPDDPANYGGEYRFAPPALQGNWFAAFDLSSFYSIGVLVPGDTEDAFPTYVHLLCNPPLGNGTGEYPIVPSGSCSNMENLFFEKQLGVLEPGESAEYEFYQWGGYGGTRSELAATLWEDAEAVLPDPASVDHLPGSGDPGGPRGDQAPPLLSYAIAPNPVTGRTEILFELRMALPVSLVAFDVRGRAVRTFVEQTLGAGRHTVPWQGEDDHGALLPAGVYLLRLRAGDGSVVRKVTLDRS